MCHLRMGCGWRNVDGRGGHRCEPRHADPQRNRAFAYALDSTFAGTDSFTYTASDGHGGMATATVTGNVMAATAGSISTVGARRC